MRIRNFHQHLTFSTFLFLSLFLITSLSSYGQTQIGSDIDGEAADDISGRSVSISSDGTRVAIGAYQNDDGGLDAGHVRIYEYSGGSWTQLGSDIDGGAAGDQFGFSVSISGDGTRVAIGAQRNDDGGMNAGQVQVYEYSAGSWTQLGGDITGSSVNGFMGRSVSFSSNGTRLAVGAHGVSNSRGIVEVYDYSGGSWTQVGNTISGTMNFASFGDGLKLSADGTRLAAGGPFAGLSLGSNEGRARVFELSGGTWNQIGSTFIGQTTQDKLGAAIALSSDGSRLALGTYFDDNGNGIDAGLVQIYEYSAGSWTQLGSDLLGAANDFFGRSLSFSSDGNTLLITAHQQSFGNGYAKVYTYNAGSWTQTGSTMTGDALNDRFGVSSSITPDGLTMVIGGHLHNNSTGHVKIFSSNPSLLPVELTDFTGVATVEGNHLIWQTASELNNAGFEIERGQKTTKKSQIKWEVIDFVSGNGTTTETIYYEFMDNQPFEGENYYRLKQIDYDGVYEYSKIVLVNTTIANNQKTVAVHPNPVSTQLTITNGKGQLTIYNALGQPIKSLEVSENFTQIPMTNLPSGQYFLTILSKDGTKTTKRIIKE